MRGILLLLAIFITGLNTGGELTITVQGIKNNNGVIEINLYNAPAGFPGDITKSAKRIYAEIKNNKAEITISELDFGEYAISVYHDENNNKKLESNWLGIPKEGVGISNDAKGSFGPPKYDDAKFLFNKHKQSMKISINYL